LSWQDEPRYKFYREINKVMLELAESVQSGEEVAKDRAVARSLDLLRESNKSDASVPLADADMAAAVAAEISRQEGFVNGLNELSKFFGSKGLEFEPMPPDKIYRDPCWRMGYVHGCSVQTPGFQFLYAHPLVPIFHNQYMSLAAGPVPGNILLARDDLLLILPYGESLKENFVEAGNELWGEMEELELKIPGVKKAWLRGNFLYLLTLEGLSDKELLRLKTDLEVPAVLVANQEERTERLYCVKTERLLDYFFDIEGNW
jgi:hypothetical protein